MNKLYEFSGKYVKVELNDGQIIKGYCYGYDSSEDNEEGIASIDIIPDKEWRSGNFFYANQIKSIEEISYQENREWLEKTYGKR